MKESHLLKETFPSVKRIAIVLVLVVIACVLLLLLRSGPTNEGSNHGDRTHSPVGTNSQEPAVQHSVSQTEAAVKTESIAQSNGSNLSLDHITQEVIKDVERIIPQEAHPWQSKLVQTMSSESIEETINNLPNFDDLSLAETSVMGMRIAPDHGPFQAICVTRLTRVRKILALGRSQPETVIPLLREKLLYAIDGFQQARKAFDDMVKRSGGRWAEGTWAQSEPSELTKRQTWAAAAVYLLTELGDYESLPILTRMYQEMEGPINPAPYDYAVYAMYQLLKVHPRKGLNQQQLGAFEECLSTGKDLASPNTTTLLRIIYC